MHKAAIDFKVSMEMRIDWGELDYYGHINNVFFFRYAQTARVNYWDQIGLTQYHLESNIGPLLASCKCDFKRKLLYPGNIRVFTKTEKMGNTSFTFVHHIYDQHGELAAEVTDVMVMFDYHKNHKVPLQQWLRDKIAALEGRKC